LCVSVSLSVCVSVSMCLCGLRGRRQPILRPQHDRLCKGEAVVRLLMCLRFFVLCFHFRTHILSRRLACFLDQLFFALYCRPPALPRPGRTGRDSGATTASSSKASSTSGSSASITSVLASDKRSTDLVSFSFVSLFSFRCFSVFLWIFLTPTAHSPASPCSKTRLFGDAYEDTVRAAAAKLRAVSISVPGVASESLSGGVSKQACAHACCKFVL
jgi:hypothetical protein